MDRTEQELREEYFDGPESDYKSFAQFLLDKGFPVFVPVFVPVVFEIVKLVALLKR